MAKGGWRNLSLTWEMDVFPTQAVLKLPIEKRALAYAKLIQEDHFQKGDLWSYLVEISGRKIRVDLEDETVIELKGVLNHVQF